MMKEILISIISFMKIKVDALRYPARKQAQTKLDDF